MPCRTELVLAHPAGTPDPRRTQDWLRARTVDRHHHVVVGRDDDVDRVARLLLGRGIGVVFSGGGARGFAAVGVLRALEELRVPIDAVGGASVGAIIADRRGAGSVGRPHRAAPSRRGRRDVTVRHHVPGDLTRRRAARHAAPPPEHRRARPRRHLAQGVLRLHEPDPGRRRDPPLRAVLVRRPGELVDTGCAPADAQRGRRPPRRRRAPRQPPGRGDARRAPRHHRRRRGRRPHARPRGRQHAGWRCRVRLGGPAASSRPGAPGGATAEHRTDPDAAHGAGSGPFRSTRATCTSSPPVDPFGITDFKSFERLIEVGYVHALPTLEAWLASDAAAPVRRPGPNLTNRSGGTRHDGRRTRDHRGRDLRTHRGGPAVLRACATSARQGDGEMTARVRPNMRGGSELGPVTAAETGRHLAILGSTGAALANPKGGRHFYLAFDGEIRRSRARVEADHDGDLIVRARAVTSWTSRRRSRSPTSVPRTVGRSTPSPSSSSWSPSPTSEGSSPSTRRRTPPSTAGPIRTRTSSACTTSRCGTRGFTHRSARSIHTVVPGTSRGSRRCRWRS